MQFLSEIPYVPVIRSAEEIAEEIIYVACYDLNMALAIRELQREIEELQPLSLVA